MSTAAIRHGEPRSSSTHAADVWAKIAEPLPPDAVKWRQDGKPTQRDGKWFARFVAYVDAHAVRERLDSVVPGEWDLVLEPLRPFVHADGTVNDEQAVSFKGRLQILGVIRECVGSGPNYKEAATDAFKRAAVRFGVAHELYSMGANWVQVEGDSKYAKPVEDPGTAYARRHGTAGSQSARSPEPIPFPTPASKSASAPASAPAAAAGDVPNCPKCSGRMWDNRVGKKNSKAPDFKCRDKSCDGAIWPPKNGASPAPATRETVPADEGPPDWEDFGAF